MWDPLAVFMRSRIGPTARIAQRRPDLVTLGPQATWAAVRCCQSFYHINMSSLGCGLRWISSDACRYLTRWRAVQVACRLVHSPASDAIRSGVVAADALQLVPCGTLARAVIVLSTYGRHHVATADRATATSITPPVLRLLGGKLTRFTANSSAWRDY